MEGAFLDTNVIIRYLTRDDPKQAESAYHLFQQLDRGERAVRMSEAVLVEAVYVLSSKALYDIPRSEIKTHLSAVLTLRGLKVSHKRGLLRALELYASTNLDFVDMLTVAHAERTNIRTVLSFDRDFDRIQGITRQEP